MAPCCEWCRICDKPYPVPEGRDPHALAAARAAHVCCPVWLCCDEEVPVFTGRVYADTAEIAAELFVERLPYSQSDKQSVTVCVCRDGDPKQHRFLVEAVVDIEYHARALLSDTLDKPN